FLHPQNQARADASHGTTRWVAAYARRYAATRKGGCLLEHSNGPGHTARTGRTAADAVAAWASEKNYYNCSDDSCGGMGCTLTHYKQMVWKVGCAAVNCDAAGGTFIVCEYDPPGNVPVGCGHFNQTGK
uniref:SCP domain-containing protein n=1 Tax=Oryza brachyantha TaxID=4533 RepID=J3LCU3_ORYBR